MMRNLRRFYFISASQFALAAVLMSFGGSARADTTNAAPAAASAEADKAWKEVEKALIAPSPPGEWQLKQPTQEQKDAFRAEMARLAGVAADKAKDFSARFPNDSRAAKARQSYDQLLQDAVMLGNTNKLAELEERQQARANDPNASEDERVQLRVQAIQRTAAAKEAQGEAAVLAEFERGARELQQAFPNRDEARQLLLMVAEHSDVKKARALAAEVIAGTQKAQLKMAAQDLLDKLDLLGKPLDLKFTALDGREVDLRKLAGKVVLVDFWATWCGPCVAELPNVKAAYDKLHAKGLEVVGISFDQGRDKLQTFVAREEIKWPQYFDGLLWENKFGLQFGIHSIPTMWLVDKQGNLRDLNGRDDLAGKVEKLLAE
jgi:thiol-disulfide isomerase/thioredoxin